MTTIKKWLCRILAVANILVVVMMLLTGYSGYVNPVDHPLWAASGMAFPLVLAANVIFIPVWLLLRRRYLLIPLLGIVFCFSPVRTYIPFNFVSELPEGSIKVISFNVHLFEGWRYHTRRDNPTVNYLLDADADIICLQEAGLSEVRNVKVDKLMAKRYPYVSRTMNQSNGVALYSKWPILSTERIEYASAGNVSDASLVLIDGDTVLVVNNHLETYGLSPDDKLDFDDIVTGKEQTEESTAKDTNDKSVKNDKSAKSDKSVKGDKKDKSKKKDKKSKQKKKKKKKTRWDYLEAVKRADKLRAPQAEAVADYIRRSGVKSVIVCGDLNDHPLSYAHHTVGKGLTDCFVAGGNGPGFTYDHHKMYFRIDHIFCSKDWRCYTCHVDRNVSLSDHYPVICTLKKRLNR